MNQRPLTRPFRWRKLGTRSQQNPSSRTRWEQAATDATLGEEWHKGRKIAVIVEERRENPMPFQSAMQAGWKPNLDGGLPLLNQGIIE